MVYPCFFSPEEPYIFKATTFKNKWEHFVNSDLETLEKGKALVKEEGGEGLKGPQ